MKYMMSCRQSLVDLEKADEIRIDYKDKNRIYDLIKEDQVINKNIYIYVQRNQEVDWNFLSSFKETFNITLAVEEIQTLAAGLSHGFRAFWSFPIYTYGELRWLISIGVSEVLLGAPLYFDLPQVKQVCGDNVEIRLIANDCANGDIFFEHPECGTYIRPEDVEAYSQYVSHLEFKTNTLTVEKALIGIYKSGKWPGNLNLIINNLNYNIDNRSFNVDFANRRIKCRQRCLRDDSCHLCSSLFTTYTAINKNKDWLAKQLNIDL